MEGAFDGLPGFINSGNIFVYLLCARFCGRQCEGYTCIYDINMFIFFRSLSRDKNVYTYVYDRSTMAGSTLWMNWYVA